MCSLCRCFLGRGRCLSASPQPVAERHSLSRFACLPDQAPKICCRLPLGQTILHIHVEQSRRTDSRIVAWPDRKRTACQKKARAATHCFQVSYAAGQSAESCQKSRRAENQRRTLSEWQEQSRGLATLSSWIRKNSAATGAQADYSAAVGITGSGRLCRSSVTRVGVGPNDPRTAARAVLRTGSVAFCHAVRTSRTPCFVSSTPYF